MGDIKSPRLIYIKGFLFLFTGLVAALALILENLNLRDVFLLLVAIWSFARFYYFAFYVIEHYVDPGYRFAGLWSFCLYLLRRSDPSQQRSAGDEPTVPISNAMIGSKPTHETPITMLTLRKATLSDFDFLVMADLSSDGYTDFPTPMTPEERQEHRIKIAGFVQGDESRAGWVYENSEHNRPVGMILCRWRERPPQGIEEHAGDSVFSELADSLFPADGRFCEKFQLWVDPAVRRRGLGTRLKEQVEVECRRRGIGMIYTHTEAQNLHVIALNEKLGYRQVRQGPIWDEVPRVSLVKRLDDV